MKVKSDYIFRVFFFLVSSPGTFAKNRPGVNGLEKAGLQKCSQIRNCSSVTFVHNTKNTLCCKKKKKNV